jgi:hypothetical protein
MAYREFTIRPYNQRMASRIARRAKLNEEGVAVAFTFNNLFTMLLLGVVEDVVRFVPVVGEFVELGLSILGFYFHRIVLVTERNVCVYRDWPFHYPGKMLLKLERGPGVVRIGAPEASSFMRFIRRGQLTFQDGTVAYHSFFFIRRAQYIAQEANIPAGQ